METNAGIQFDTNLAKKILGVLLGKYLDAIGEKLSEAEIEAVLSTIVEHRQENILELHIYKKFILEAEPEKQEGSLYFHQNSISLTVQEGGEDVENSKVKDIPIIGDTALVGEDNVYTIYSISIPIVRVINILTGILLEQAGTPEGAHN